MIIVRSPLRIPFVGDGTDLPGFSGVHGGRVLSATIDKFVYLVIKPTLLVNKYIVKYQSIESVSAPKELKHDRIRESLLDLGINEGVEIASFSDIPARTGLGSSGSFSVALMKGLHSFLGRPLSKAEAAEEASRLEIDILQEPIGKQDQYAAAFGGFNIFNFLSDLSVTVEPVLLDYKKRFLLRRHLLVFYTGLMRDARSVLEEQTRVLEQHTNTYKQMAKVVPDFHEALLNGDVKKMAQLVDQEWGLKKTLSSNVTTPEIDALYETGMAAGAMGGKLLGAGSGGCLLFFAMPESHQVIRQAVKNIAGELRLNSLEEIHFEFVQSGASILFNNFHQIR